MKRSSSTGPVVSEKQFNRIMSLCEEGKKEANLICGGERLTGGIYDKGFYIGPTVFGNVENSMTIYFSETIRERIVIQQACFAGHACLFLLTTGVGHFSKLEYISSAGVREVVAAYRKQKERKGAFAVINTGADVYDVFDMTGLTKKIDIREEKD